MRLESLFSEHFRERARQVGLQELIARIREFGRHHFLAGQKKRVRHFSERQPQSECRRGKDRRPVQCFRQDTRELAVSSWIWRNGIDRSGKRRGCQRELNDANRLLQR